MRLRLEYLVYLVVVLCYVQYALSRLTGSVLAAQVDEACVLVLFVCVVLTRLEEGRLALRRTHMDLFLVLFGLSFATSAIANGVPVPNVLLSAKGYFTYVLFFYCLVHVGNAEHVQRRLLKLVLVCFVLQLPIVLLEYGWALVSRGGVSDDIARGTFSGANMLSYSAFFPAVYTTHLVLSGSANRWAKYCLPLLLGVLILPLGEFAIVAYFLCIFPPVLARMLRSKRAMRLVIAGGVVLVMVLSGFTVFRRRYSRNPKPLSYTLDPAAWYQRLSVGQNTIYSGAQRNLYFPLTYVHLQHHAYHPLLGMGPGMYASYAAFQLMPATNKLVHDAFGQSRIGRDPYVDSQVIPVWGEFGYLGLLLFVVFLLYSTVHYLRMIRWVRDRETRSLAYVAGMGSLYILVGFYANHVWESQTLFMTCTIFWALATVRVRLQLAEHETALVAGRMHA